MDEQWWDGWIGALLAAAVTVGATVWWDARVRRRERLEDAVVRLHEAASALLLEVDRVTHRSGSIEEVLDAHLALGNALVLVRGQALRRVFLLPARIVAPARSGLARTVGLLSERWNRASLAQNRRGMLKHPDAVKEACRAVSIACLVWLANPMTFWPGRQRGPEFLEKARRSEE